MTSLPGDDDFENFDIFSDDPLATITETPKEKEKTSEEESSEEFVLGDDISSEVDFEDVLYETEKEVSESLGEDMPVEPKLDEEAILEQQRIDAEIQARINQKIRIEKAYDRFLSKASLKNQLDKIKHTPIKALPPLTPLKDKPGIQATPDKDKDSNILTREIDLKELLSTEIKVDKGLKLGKDILTKEIKVDKGLKMGKDILTKEIKMDKGVELLTTDISLSKSKR